MSSKHSHIVRSFPTAASHGSVALVRAAAGMRLTFIASSRLSSRPATAIAPSDGIPG